MLFSLHWMMAIEDASEFVKNTPQNLQENKTKTNIDLQMKQILFTSEKRGHFLYFYNSYFVISK